MPTAAIELRMMTAQLCRNVVSNFVHLDVRRLIRGRVTVRFQRHYWNTNLAMVQLLVSDTNEDSVNEPPAP
jgi:hypothetical protein